MVSRSRCRQFAVQMLYQNDFSGHELETGLELFWRGIKADGGTRRFTESLVRGVLDHQAELDLEITAYLQDWSLDRIVVVDRLVLQLAFYELLHSEDIPWKVIVDEAVLLCKSFSSDKSATFINGVLHAWAMKNRGQDADKKAAPVPKEDETP